MTIELKEDVMYILLTKMGDRPMSDEAKPIKLSPTDFTGRSADKNEILSHLDYLNQKGYIEAEFEGDAYADEGPNPLPDHVGLRTAKITAKGKELLEQMKANPPAALQTGPSTPIATKDTDFLEKVMLKGNIEDIYDARDITEIVFRTMRDLMTNEAQADIASDLHTTTLETDKKALSGEVSDLWKDSNPLVRFLSKIRPPLKFSDDTFLFRIEKEAGLPKTTGPNTVVKAVFSATKEELSGDRIAEVAEFLPGKVRTLWEEA